MNLPSSAEICEPAPITCLTPVRIWFYSVEIYIGLKVNLGKLLFKSHELQNQKSQLTQHQYQVPTQ